MAAFGREHFVILDIRTSADKPYLLNVLPF